MGQIKAKTMMQKSGFVDSDKKSPEHDKIQKWIYNNPEKVLDTIPILKGKNFKILNKKWEYTLLDKSYLNRDSYPIAGYIDLAFYLEASSPIVQNNSTETSVYVEIKTSIPSLGELIRQLRFYENYLELDKGIRILVVCPDDSDQQILEEQGFWFYKYKDETKLF